MSETARPRMSGGVNGRDILLKQAACFHPTLNEHSMLQAQCNLHVKYATLSWAYMRVLSGNSPERLTISSL